MNYPIDLGILLVQAAVLAYCAFAKSHPGVRLLIAAGALFGAASTIRRVLPVDASYTNVLWWLFVVAGAFSAVAAIVSYRRRTPKPPAQVSTS